MSIKIMNGPFEVYMAPVDETYPDITATPAGNWALIGSSGSRHHTEDGVTISISQEMEKIYGAGGTELLKVYRTQEDAVIRFTLFDLSSGQFVKAFNLATTTTDTAAGASTGGHQSWGLLRGLSVTNKALLIRGENKSSDLITENVQFEIPAVAQMGNLEVVYSKGGQAGLLFELQAIADYTYGSGSFPYGKILIGDAAPTG